MILGRFIKRGRDGEKDNAAILILAENGVQTFKEDTVYQIEEWCGEMIIRPIGKSQMDPKHWGHEIQDVMMNHKPLITKEEMLELEL